jgi:hypothetical protein
MLNWLKQLWQKPQTDDEQRLILERELQNLRLERRFSNHKTLAKVSRGAGSRERGRDENTDFSFPNLSTLLLNRCSRSKKGRSISIHPDEKFFSELRERQLSSLGREKLRERVAVEHSLSHIGRIQGDKARYLEVRKNLFDLRRSAVVHNLHILARMGVYQEEKVS